MYVYTYIHTYIYTHTYIYNQVTFIFSRNWHNIVDQLHFNLKNGKKEKSTFSYKQKIVPQQDWQTQNFIKKEELLRKQ